MIQVVVSQLRARALFTTLFRAGLQAVDPYEAVCRQVRFRRGQLTIGSERYPLSQHQRLVVVGAGKASGRMAQALERQLGARIDTGLIVVKYGHGAPTKKIRILEAGHPVPDEAVWSDHSRNECGSQALVLCKRRAACRSDLRACGECDPLGCDRERSWYDRVWSDRS